MSETVIFLNAEFTTEIDVNTFLLTLHFLPFVADDGYVRIGILGGAGPSTYEFSLSDNISNVTVGVNSSGTAVLAGVYIDWGGEDFGARVGFNALTTDFDPLQISGELTARDVDGSGTSFYFDLRWAFG